MLTERRKADRIKMADQVVAICWKFGIGATAIPHGECYVGPHATMVKIKGPRGLCLNLDFDGKSGQPDVFVLPWHIRSGEAKLSLAFEARAGSVNPYHRQKCTAVAYGFERLIDHLELVFTCVQAGAAFEA